MQKLVIVTGASRGIGAKTAVILAEAGFDVVVNWATNKESAETVVKEIQSLGRKAIAVQADVSKEEEVIALFKEADNFGPLWGLVNNAGIIGKGCRVDEITPEILRQCFEINVYGSFYCAKQAIMRLSMQKGGKGGVIVNLCSMAAFLGSPHAFVYYAATKGAILSFTKGLALEVARDGIRVNAVAPGLIDTEIFNTTKEPDRAHNLASTVPLGLVGKPEEVAEVIKWLLEDSSSYVLGETIHVSGGR